MVVFVVLLWLSGEDVSTSWTRFATGATVVVVVLEGVYERWAWGWLSGSLTGRPDLRGTWRGTLTTHWVDPKTGLGPGPKPCYIVIHQTASTERVTLLTDESKSTSSASEVVKSGSGWSLRYLYGNEPQIAVDHRSNAHNGAVVLTTDSEAKTLEGHYWTDRNSRGELAFGERSKKQAATNSEAASLDWPSSLACHR